MIHLVPHAHRWLAFVRDGEVFAVRTEVADGKGREKPKQLTWGAGNGITNGLAEFIAQVR